MAASTIAQDTFSRANQSGLGTASDGEAYSTLSGSATVSIASNRGQFTGSAGTTLVQLGSGSLTNGDWKIRFSLSATNDLIGFLYRENGLSNYMRLEIANNTLRLKKIVSGVVTTLSAQGGVTLPSVSTNTNYWIHLNASGTTHSIRVWADGTQEPSTWNATYSDSSLTTPGAYGILVSVTAANDVILVDSFSVNATTSLWYVSPTGNDANPGTQAQPFATLQQAANVVCAGDTVHVAAGTYTQANGVQLTFTASGTPLAQITYQSDSLWGALVRSLGVQYCLLNSGSYVTISGFDVASSAPSTDGTCRMGILLNNCSWCVVQGCRVHDIPAWNNGGTNGGAGIDMNGNTSGNNTVSANRVWNIGTASGPNGPGDLVHGVYFGNGPGNAYNNIIYNISGFGINSWHAAANLILTNNLIFGCTRGGLFLGANPGEGTMSNSSIQNNIIAFNPNAFDGAVYLSPSGSYGAGNQMVDNLIYGNSNVNGQNSQIFLNGVMVDSGTIYSNPQFVNFQANGAGNYHVLLSSPAIAAGTSTNAPSVDFDGFPRPASGCDIGPYQYQEQALVSAYGRDGQVTGRSH